jgi:hypothetical protein
MSAVRFLSALLGILLFTLAFFFAGSEFTNTDLPTEIVIKVVVGAVLVACAVPLLSFSTQLGKRWVLLWLLGWILVLSAAVVTKLHSLWEPYRTSLGRANTEAAYACLISRYRDSGWVSQRAVRDLLAVQRSPACLYKLNEIGFACLKCARPIARARGRQVSRQRRARGAGTPAFPLADQNDGSFHACPWIEPPFPLADQNDGSFHACPWIEPPAWFARPLRAISSLALYAPVGPLWSPGRDR